MNILAFDSAEIGRDSATRLIARKRRAALAVPALILIYFAYVFVAYDVAGVIAGARGDNAATLVADRLRQKIAAVGGSQGT